MRKGIFHITSIHILLLLLVTCFTLLFSCGTLSHVNPQPSQQTEVHVVDSIAWHDSTAIHHVYKEIYNDYTDLLDTLNMSTTYSEFSAWIDTTKNVLKGKAENKDIDIPIKIKWKEKIVYKDSIVTKEIPVPYEVEKIKYKHYWYESILCLFALIGLAYIIVSAIKLYVKKI